MSELSLWFPVIGLAGLLCAGLVFLFIARIPVTNPVMVEISEAIHHGAMVFLRREYSILAIFIVVVFALLTTVISFHTALAFLARGVQFDAGRVLRHAGRDTGQRSDQPGGQ